MSIICNAMFMIVLSFVLIKEYSVIQSYHYELSKYFYHIKNNKKNYYYFLYFLLGIFVIKFELLYLAISSLLLIYLVKKYDLKYTFRVKRVLIINFIILTIMLLTNTLKYVFILPFLYLLLVHSISLLVEKLVYLKFLKKAKRKIKNKFVIGVTGSAGKTSVKNIIYDLMINDFNVGKTPKSYNNKVGIVKSINEHMSVYDDYFVCEYGVDKVKAMDKLLKIVQPNIAVVTEIGNQHLLSFKSQENILHEKIKLIDNLKDKGTGIINNDNKYLREYDYKNLNILRYGINHESDVMAKNIVLKDTSSEFDLYIKNKYITRVNTTLLSTHSVENILCGVCVCLCLDMGIDKIIKNLKNVTPVPHRLEYKVSDEVEIIDDSFNSNIKGFKEALEILNKSNKYKILITPGIIEQGSNNKNVSYEIAHDIINNVDYVYLVSDNSMYIKEYFDLHEFSNYESKTSFKEAFDSAKKIDRQKIILIENDLPNIYLK